MFFLVSVVCLCFYWCCFHGLLVLFLVFFFKFARDCSDFINGLLLLFLISFLWFARPFVGCHFLSVGLLSLSCVSLDDL